MAEPWVDMGISKEEWERGIKGLNKKIHESREKEEREKKEKERR